MRGLFKKLRNFLSSSDGPTAVEYAVMLALIIVVAVASITVVGQRTSTTFNNISKKMPSS
jgi:pilus assembly protein Flp/PilA